MVEKRATHAIDAAGARVLVTGATSGVGEATARLFASLGARVALVGRREDELSRIASEIGPGAIPIVADVADARQARAAVHRAIDALGGLDVAVNAAGVATLSPLAELDDVVWRHVIDTNLTGTFTVSREAALHMRAAGRGSIVNVASDMASMGHAGLVHYSAAKAGVVGLSRGLAVELAPTVRVNVIAPGPIDTPMFRGGREGAALDEAIEAKTATVPLDRLAQPDEVARGIVYLAIDATFATGSTLSFDGGTTAA